MEKHSEFILAVDSDFTWNMKGPLHTDRQDIESRFKRIEGHLAIRRRRELDTPNSRLAYLQLLPYFILSLRSDNAPKKFFAYQRTERVGEELLAGMFSIGIGGHIDITDLVLTGAAVNVFATLMKASQREMTEEVVGDGVPIIPLDGNIPAALIADGSDDVGRRHLGLVRELQCYSEDVKCAEEELITVGFLTVQELTERYAMFESWSRILIDKLIENEEVFRGAKAAP